LNATLHSEFETFTYINCLLQLSIPYQAMNNMSNVLKKQVFRSLAVLASNVSDHRSASACFELCVCYLSGFGAKVDQDQATHWLLEAARRGDLWAQASSHSILNGTTAQRSSKSDLIDQWLCNAALNGSLKALRDLRLRNSAILSQALEGYRSLYPTYSNSSDMIPENIESLFGVFAQALRVGAIEYSHPLNENKDTILHLAAQFGRTDVFLSGTLASYVRHSELDINARNIYGDTPLLFAARSGSLEIVKVLLDLGADAGLSNHLGENCLHFLVCFPPSDFKEVATLLVGTGADIHQDATGSSIHQNYAGTPFVPGNSLVRAAVFDSSPVLEILLELDAQRHLEAPATVEQTRKSRVQVANFRKILAWAYRLCSVDVVGVLLEQRPDIFPPTDLRKLTFWVRSTRQSLLSLMINGYISPEAGCGLNFPERFVRYLHHGERWLQNLSVLLSQFYSVGTGSAFDEPCGSSRNALRFAIQHGRTDVVSCILDLPLDDEFQDPFSIFGYEEQTWTVLTANIEDFQQSNVPLHRRKLGLVSCIELSITQGHLEIFQLLLRTRGGEALDEGVPYPLVHLVSDYDRHKLIRIVMIYLGYRDVSFYFPNCRPVFHAPKLHKIMTRIRSKSRNYLSLSEGKISYGLLYMIFIAKTSHYDLQFA
jgi:ankyrin repeat protein